MIELLTTISLISGGILLLLLLLSIISGLDFDIDLDFNSDFDSGSLGIFKGVLTFVSIGAWTVKLFLTSQLDPVLAFTLGAAAGAVAVWVLSILLKFMLAQQADVNWSLRDALYQQGTVYLLIPAAGEGLVNIPIKGTNRELKARSASGEPIPTGTPVLVEDLTADGYVLVRPTT
ncbi:hypothetical protein QWY85_14360 [Neolewinella lacunae]|uniref:NfeD-like C-terminal domain-containing protein n=1 Tax=Neolewinella lacunae TaxID=1517758 RepID=A0A923T7M3_9BACT|nr:hypothetical protein [Neolewinella lacunae]MBC6993028.1 hypothetical protein [Neolewinella lacunae]MDN3635850.1 hypothetical protein [Neolewinella lacunae]